LSRCGRTKQKTRQQAGFIFSLGQARNSSLDFGFLVRDVLANHRIEFFHFQLLRGRALVLGRRVKVPGSGGGNQFDLIAHDNILLYLGALGAQLSENDIDASLVDDPHTVRRHAQADETPFAFDPEPMYVQVWQEPTAGLVIRMRNIVSSDGTFSRHLTDSGHRAISNQ
jgi:hypothetical protein